MNNSKEFKKDKEAEEEVADFLDKYFYNKYFNDEVKRCNDDKLQNEGVDVFVDDGMVIDEKAAIHYYKEDINEASMPTFILELYFEKNGIPMDGWLYGDKYKQTTHYLIMWLWVKNKKVTCENIMKIEAVLVKKKDIITLLDNLGFPKERLKQIVSDVLNNGNFEIPEFKNLKLKPFEVKQSTNLPEKPINLVVKRIVYEKVCEKIFTITPKEVICKCVTPIVNKNYWYSGWNKL